MRLERSPGFDQYKEGLPEPPTDPEENRKRFRFILLIALLLVLALSGVNFLGSQSAAILTKTGALRGVVLDQDGQPFQGEIFILGTELATSTNVDGSFSLERVPAGSRSLIVADDLIGREFPVEVVPGETMDIGQVQFFPTATP